MMKKYNVRMGSGSMVLTESDIAVLFRSGGIKRETACAELGNGWWKTVDELFPLLKHNGHVSSGFDQYPSTTKSSQTSAMTAGWICFGIGAAVSWFFPLGYIFFSVALVMAVVAMATHQVSRGLILLLSSFLAMGVSMVISFFLAIGLFAAAAGHVITKAEEDMKTRNAVIDQQTRAFNQAMQNATQAFPIPSSKTAGADDITRQIDQLNRAIQQTGPTFQQVPAQRTTNAFQTPRPAATFSAPVRPAADTSVAAQLRRIEQQKRDRENYKRQHDSLQNSIDYWEKLARSTRREGRDFAANQADALRNQLQELNNRNLGM